MEPEISFNWDIVKMEPESPDSASAVPASALSIESLHRTAQLIVEGKPLYVNPHFLAEASPVFEALFFGSFQEAENKMVELKDELFGSVFDFLMVLGVCPREERRKVTGRNCSALLRLADKFDVSIVRKQCEEFLTSRIFVEVETPPPEQLAKILLTAAEIGMSSTILTNLVGLLGAVGVDQLLTLNMHTRLVCPKVSAALFAYAAAAEHLTARSKYNTHSQMLAIPSPICMFVSCQMPGSPCDNCGLALCEEHGLSLKCPKAKPSQTAPAEPPRRLVDGEICGFKVIPCRKRYSSVNAFFNPAPPSKKGK